MKVTVSFDAVRLVVPAGDGQMPVGQLIDQALARYRKTVGKVAIGAAFISVDVVNNYNVRRQTTLTAYYYILMHCLQCCRSVLVTCCYSFLLF